MSDARNLTQMSAIVAAFVYFAALAGAQQQAPPLKVTKIKDNVYWAQDGVGSNDGIIVGTTGGKSVGEIKSSFGEPTAAPQPSPNGHRLPPH